MSVRRPEPDVGINVDLSPSARVSAIARAARLAGAITALAISPIAVAADAVTYGLYDREEAVTSPS